MAAEFSPDMAAGICDRIAAGESLRAICKGEGMPSKALFLLWVSKDSSLRETYALAMEHRAEAMFEDLNELAIGAESQCKDMVQVQARRLALDQGKWTLAHLLPKKYSDRVMHTGDDGGAIQFVVTRSGSTNSQR